MRKLEEREKDLNERLRTGSSLTLKTFSINSSSCTPFSFPPPPPPPPPPPSPLPTSGDFSCLPGDSSTVQDVMFGISGTDDGERQRLIRTGLLTPFGGTSDTAREGLMNGALPSQPQATSLSTTMSEFDWLGVTSSSSSSSSLSGAPAGKGKGSAKKTKSTLSKRGSVATAVHESDSNGHQTKNHDTPQNETGPSTQHETESRDSLYRPSSEEEEESSYYTDEELGGGDSQKRGKRKKRRIAHDFSSDSSGEDELMEEMRRRARRRKRKGGTIDDGDEEIYRLRMR